MTDMLFTHGNVCQLADCSKFDYDNWSKRGAEFLRYPEEARRPGRKKPRHDLTVAVCLRLMVVGRQLGISVAVLVDLLSDESVKQIRSYLLSNNRRTSGCWLHAGFKTGPKPYLMAPDRHVQVLVQDGNTGPFPECPDQGLWLNVRAAAAFVAGRIHPAMAAEFQ